MPTQLDGVTVTVNGQNAFVDYISPTQVNALTPLDATNGPVKVVLTSAGVASAPVTVTLGPVAPSFFLFAGKYVAATHVDYSYLGPASLGAGFTPAAPGETILLFANGFGNANPAIVPGASTQVGTLPVNPAITIGGIAAKVSNSALISPGLYQFNVVVPANVPSGDNAMTATYQGGSAPAGIFLTVK